MGPVDVNAVSAGLSAIAAIFAVVIAGISVRELRRIDERATRREANQRDEALQMRLEALYPQLYSVFGVPLDRIPSRLRSAVVGFFGLYADAYTAHRDSLLPERDSLAFLEEFDWWVGSENGKTLWEQLRCQSWPVGFIEHVDSAAQRPRAYAGLANRAAEFGLRAEVPGVVEFHDNPGVELLRSADWALVNLRIQGHSEFPPSSIDDAFLQIVDPRERRAAQRRSYAEWFLDSDTLVWGRWVAVLNGRVVGHVAVCEPHDYLRVDDRADPASSIRTLEVSRLFVEPRLQGRGIGAEILGRAIDFIEDFGCTPVLAVLAESEGALAMYRRYGWTEIDRFDGTQGENVVMVLAGR
ncbi:MAG: GNAT family N-acetyltransferase [Actinomycetota bacterium]